MNINDAEFIERALEWPCFPWLPLKNTTESGRLGLIHVNDVANIQLGVPDARLRVFDANLFDIGTRYKRIRDMPVYGHYESSAAVTADGWIID